MPRGCTRILPARLRDSGRSQLNGATLADSSAQRRKPPSSRVPRVNLVIAHPKPRRLPLQLLLPLHPFLNPRPGAGPRAAPPPAPPHTLAPCQSLSGSADCPVRSSSSVGSGFGWACGADLGKGAFSQQAVTSLLLKCLMPNGESFSHAAQAFLVWLFFETRFHHVCSPGFIALLF